MNDQNIYDYLKDLDICKVCILRYLNGRCNEYLNVEKALQDRGVGTADTPTDGNTTDSGNISKKIKPNVCIVCLDLFQDNTIDTVVQQVLEKTDLHSYDCDSIYTSVSLPILIQVRELTLWIALLRKFPEAINDTQPPNISVKEILKYLINLKVCAATNKRLEHDQNGILVNVFFEHECENDEISKLELVAPSSFTPSTKRPRRRGQHQKKSASSITRNAIEKHFFPKNLDIEECLKCLPVPPNTVDQAIKLTNVHLTGPTVFVAGRYRKLSRELSQSPWILGGKRVMADSVQEIIAKHIAPYFGVDPTAQANQLKFMASGREDVDVRCLGKGRPFVVEIMDSKKTSLPKHVAAEMEVNVEKCQRVSVQHLQLVKREELTKIKQGEETKKKTYRALCILHEPATVELLRKLDMPEGFLMQQKTPLRVLHRRPYLTRPRQVYSLKGSVHKDDHKLIILDVTTQAGTYVKEMVHGEFGRSRPSIQSIIGQEIDIIALDVMSIDLDWPEEIDNRIQ